MLSNHYGMLYSHRWNWVILVLLMLGGALIRHFFVARHKTHVKGKPAPWGWAAAGVAPLLGAIALDAPWDRLNTPPPRADAPAANFAAVQSIVQQRCVVCHNEQVNHKGVMLHSPALLLQHAPQVHQQVVVQRLMPMNNATGITEDERALLGRWFQARR